MINVPTQATHTKVPINRNAIVRLLGKRQATAIIAGNREVLPITIQVNGGACIRSIKPEKTMRTTAKTKQSQPAMSGKILRDVFNSATPIARRAIHFIMYSIERTPPITAAVANKFPIKKRPIHRFGPSDCSSKPLARQFSDRLYSTGFANVLLHHKFALCHLRSNVNSFCCKPISRCSIRCFVGLWLYSKESHFVQ